MARNYSVMREVLAKSSVANGPLHFDDFYGIKPQAELMDELARLSSDGLLDGRIGFECGICTGGTVGGLTDEGREFYKLVENPDVWRIVYGTLEAANVDVSYPLLKEVCEEIVKRYVTSFIPDI